MIKLISKEKQDGLDPNYYRKKKVKKYSQDYFTEMNIPKYLTSSEKIIIVIASAILLFAVVKMFTL